MTRWLTRAACLLSVGSALTGCPKRVDTSIDTSGPSPAEYYPLAVGNRWTYDQTFLGAKSSLVVEIVKEDNGFFYDSNGGELTVDAVGVRDHKRYLLRSPVEPGREWKNVVSVSSVEHYKVVEAGAGCEAPFGRFERCVRVEARNRVDAKTTLVNEMTFAPAVGVVRIEVYAEVGQKRIPQTRLELREFKAAAGRK